MSDANFTPTLGEYKTLQPFRYWCQKVLPLVYDDSLSYYELLCKVIDYLNKTMEDVETLHGDVTNLHKAYVELQEYVNTYFNNLDVQNEINNKLDNMAADGTLLTIISPTISTETAKWLSQHITNPASPPIDTSLTVSGAAADAKVAGDQIRSNFVDFGVLGYSEITYAKLEGNTFTLPAGGSVTVHDYSYNISDELTCTLNIGTNFSVIYLTLNNRDITGMDSKPFNDIIPPNSIVIGIMQFGNIYIRGVNIKPLISNQENKILQFCGFGEILSVNNIEYTLTADKSRVNSISFNSGAIYTDDGFHYEVNSSYPYISTISDSEMKYNACIVGFDALNNKIVYIPFDTIFLDNNRIYIIGFCNSTACYINGMGFAHLNDSSDTSGNCNIGATPVRWDTYITWDGEKLHFGDYNWLYGKLLNRQTNLPDIVPDTKSIAYKILYSFDDNAVKLIPYDSNNSNHRCLTLGFIYNDKLYINGTNNVVSKVNPVYCFGDSIVAGTGDGVPFHYIASRLNHNHICKNYGVGATGYTTSVTDVAVNVGNGNEGDGPVIMTHGSNTILEIMKSVGNMDRILIAGGTNDNISDVNAFTTAVRDTLEYAKTKTNRILVITPIGRINETENIKTKTDIIINICNELGIEYFKGNDINILNPNNVGNKNSFMPDGIHPNEAGSAIYARAILQKFSEVFDTWCL